MKKIIVSKKYDGKKLNTFLLDNFNGLSLNTIYKALRKKDIRINNVKIIITSLCEMNMPINYVLEIINKMSDNEIKYYFSSSCDDMTKNNEEFLNDFIEKLRKVNR